jgi:hypothetical protein
MKNYTVRIRIANIDSVSLEIRDVNNEVIKEPAGVLGYKDSVQARVGELHEKARLNELQGAEVEELGKLLFYVLFDEGIRRDFIDIYRRAQQEKVLLRVELDIDERQLPGIAALPWEFMYLTLTNSRTAASQVKIGVPAMQAKKSRITIPWPNCWKTGN